MICMPVSAVVVSTADVADSRVDLNQPTTSLPTGDVFAAKEGTPETVATNLQFFYTQFDLPSGLTGQDIQTVNSAQLALAHGP